MKFDFISDQHLSQANFLKIVSELPKKSPNLVLNGDVCSISDHDGWNMFVGYLTACCSSYSMVYYIAGNHEYYSVKEKCPMRVIKEKIKSLSAIFPNFMFLDDSYHLRKEGWVIFGSTMWSDIPKQSFKSSIPIYIEIENTVENITHATWLKNHYSSRCALEEAIAVSKRMGYKLIVITHFSPLTKESLDPVYHNVAGNEMYCTDMSSYYQNVDVWLYGHTGFNYNVTKGRCSFYSNQYVSTGNKYSDAPISL